MKLGLSSPVVLVLDRPKRAGYVMVVADLRAGDATGAPRALLSGKRAHRAWMVDHRIRAHRSRPKAIA